MQFTKGRTLWVVSTLLVSGAALLVAGAVRADPTEVTVTKSSSHGAYFYYYDGATYVFLNLTELDSGYQLQYQVRDYTQTPPELIEYGMGTIDGSEASITEKGAWLDVDTSDIAVIGDGGVISIEWTPDGVTFYSTDSKSTYTVISASANQVEKVFNGISQASTLVEGSVFDETYNGTGVIRKNQGKVILQVK